MMSRMTKWTIIPAIAVALMLTTDTSKADAGGFSINVGSGGFGPGFGGYRYASGFGGYGGYNGFNNGHRAFGPVIYPGVSSRYGAGYRGYARPQQNFQRPAFVPQRGNYRYQSRNYGLYRGCY